MDATERRLQGNIRAGRNDTRRDAPSDSSEKDNTLMMSVMSGITTMEQASPSVEELCG